jgi:hypothetical protein
MMNYLKSKKVLFGMIMLNVIYYVSSLIVYNVKGLFMRDFISILVYLILGTTVSGVLFVYFYIRYSQKGIDLFGKLRVFLLTQIPVSSMFILTLFIIITSKLIID